MLCAILLYSALLIALGFFTSRRVKRAADFYVAGRGLGAPLLFSTFLAANLGAGSTVCRRGGGSARPASDRYCSLTPSDRASTASLATTTCSRWATTSSCATAARCAC